MADIIATSPIKVAVTGAPGKSAYAQAVEAGYSGTPQQYYDLLSAVPDDAAAAATSRTGAESAAADAANSRDAVAMFAGVSKTYATYAAAEADLGNIAADAYVMVLVDENHASRSCVYQKQSGALAFVYQNAPGGLSTYIATASESSIRAAATMALANGGGTVIIPAGTIAISAPLPVGDHLRYQGAPGHISFSGGVTGGGTVLVGDGVANVSPGTFNCFEWNPDDQASLPATAAIMWSTAASGFGLFDVVLRGFKHGIKAGAFQNVGIQMLSLDRVVADQCEWGFWLENCQSGVIGSVFYANCQKGGYYRGSSMGDIWHFGNDHEGYIEGQNSAGLSGPNTKGIVYEARGVSSELNSCSPFKLQANGFYTTTLTQAASAVFSYPTDPTHIAITGNIDRYAVDNRVWFGTSGSGFFNTYPYFVTEVHDNGDGTGWITAARNKGGTPVSATDAATVTTIMTRGATLLEIGGRGDQAANNVTYSHFTNIDLEVAAGISLLMQNCSGTTVETSICEGVNGGSISFCSITNQSNCRVMFGAQPINAYNDTFGLQLTGFMPASYFGSAPGGAYIGQGFFYDPAGHCSRLFAGGGDRTGKGDLYGVNADHLAFGVPFTVPTGTLFSGAPVMVNGPMVLALNNNAAGSSVQLPVISDNNVGLTLTYTNVTNNAITVNTQSGQVLNYPGAATSIRVPPRAAMQFTAMKFGSTYYWISIGSDTLIKLIGVNPPNLADGGRYTATVAIPDAALGDEVSVAIDIDTQGVGVRGYVNAAGSVTLVYENRTGAAIDLAAHNAHIRVRLA